MSVTCTYIIKPQSLKDVWLLVNINQEPVFLKTKRKGIESYFNMIYVFGLKTNDF